MNCRLVSCMSQAQFDAVDILLCTHRELTAVDLCDFEMWEMVKGGVYLKIKSGEYFYSYKIMRSGQVLQMRRGEFSERLSAIMYFQTIPKSDL